MTVEDCNVELESIRELRRILYDRLVEMENELDMIKSMFDECDNNEAYYEERRARILEQGEDDEQ